MSTAFQITADDLTTVLEKYGQSLPEKEVEAYFDTILAPREDEIEEAALGAEVDDNDENTLSNQTDAAHEKMAEILKEVGILEKDAQPV